MLLQPSATAPVRVVRADVATAPISPGIILSVGETRSLLQGLDNNGVRRGGVWHVVPGQWRRYDRAWGLDGQGDSQLLGTVHCIYDQPTRYMTTLYRVAVTEVGVAQGWTFDAVIADALWHGGLSLGGCSRGAAVSAGPRIYDDGYRHTA